MSTVTTLPVDEFLERNSGSDYHRAVLFAETAGACEAAFEEMKYDKQQDAALMDALKFVAEYDFRVPTDAT